MQQRASAQGNATFRSAYERTLPPENRGVVSVSEPSDDEIGSAIVSAMLEGRGAVAEELARVLKARREARAGVVRLDVERARRPR